MLWQDDIILKNFREILLFTSWLHCKGRVQIKSRCLVIYSSPKVWSVTYDFLKPNISPGFSVCFWNHPYLDTGQVFIYCFSVNHCLVCQSSLLNINERVNLPPTDQFLRHPALYNIVYSIMYWTIIHCTVTLRSPPLHIWRLKVISSVTILIVYWGGTKNIFTTGYSTVLDCTVRVWGFAPSHPRMN